MSIKPASKALVAYRGATFEWKLRWKSGRAATDITGYGFTFEVVDTAGTVVLTLSTSNDKITIVDALDGRFDIKASPADLAVLTLGKIYHYRLYFTPPSTTDRLLRVLGRFEVQV